MARFYSVEDFLAKGVASGSGTAQDEATREVADGSAQSIGGDGGVATDDDRGDAGDTSGQRVADVADAGYSDVPSTPAPKKPAKRA